MKKIIDISWRLDQNTTVYPGDPCFEISSIASVDSDGYSMQKISLGTHTGTHIDAPKHFSKNGGDAYSIPLNILIGDVLVLDIRGHNEISIDVIKHLNHIDKLRARERVLFKTENENLLNNSFSESYIGITSDLAEFIRKETPIRLIGIDYISIENPKNGIFTAHETLLTKESPIYILEGLDLRNVNEGVYTLLCLPLPIVNGDGAPARVVLIEKNDSII